MNVNNQSFYISPNLIGPAFFATGVLFYSLYISLSANKEPSSLTERKTSEIAKSTLGPFFFRGMRIFTVPEFYTRQLIQKQIGHIKMRTNSSAIERDYPVTPIRNMGNTCFINTAFQMIMNNNDLCTTLVTTYKELVKTCEDEVKRDAYQAFLDAVEQYKEGEVTVNMNKLRALDIGAQELYSMGDTREFIERLLDPVPVSSFPELFTSVEKHIRHERVIMSGKDNELTLQNAQEEDNRKGLQNRRVLAENDILKAPDAPFSFLIPISKSEKTLDGQKEIDKLFGVQKWQDPETRICRTHSGEYGFFKEVNEQTQIKSPPNHLTLQIGRFDNFGNKIHTKLRMPEIASLTFLDKELGSYQEKYRLKSIGIHSGNHYYAMIHTEENGWQEANDSSISSPTLGRLDNALESGLFYMYEKIKEDMKEVD